MDLQPRKTYLTGAKASPNQFYPYGDHLRIESGAIYDPDADSFSGALRVGITVVYRTESEYKDEGVAAKAATRRFEEALGRLLDGEQAE
jgi:hypothetical protein